MNHHSPLLKTSFLQYYFVPYLSLFLFLALVNKDMEILHLFPVPSCSFSLFLVHLLVLLEKKTFLSLPHFHPNIHTVLTWTSQVALNPIHIFTIFLLFLLTEADMENIRKVPPKQQALTSFICINTAFPSLRNTVTFSASLPWQLRMDSQKGCNRLQLALLLAGS